MIDAILNVTVMVCPFSYVCFGVGFVCELVNESMIISVILGISIVSFMCQKGLSFSSIVKISQYEE